MIAVARYALLLPEAFLPDGQLSLTAPLYIRHGKILLDEGLEDEDLSDACLMVIASIYQEPKELNLVITRGAAGQELAG